MSDLSIRVLPDFRPSASVMGIGVVGIAELIQNMTGEDIRQEMVSEGDNIRQESNIIVGNDIRQEYSQEQCLIIPLLLPLHHSATMTEDTPCPFSISS